MKSRRSSRQLEDICIKIRLAERLGYSESYVYSLHDEALKEMDEILSRAESQ